MTALHFSTKAGTLEALAERMASARVLPLVRFTVADYRRNAAEVTKRISTAFNGCRFLIVRSSSLIEDGTHNSGAGRFTSVSGVPAGDTAALDAAVNRVIDSYEDAVSDRDEVFLQPVLEPISRAGVVFTVDINTGAPYFCINYDESGASDRVTGGSANVNTYIRYHGSPAPCPEPWMTSLITTCRECMDLFDNRSLDIEFAFDDAGRLYIFQVRPLITAPSDTPAALNLDTYLRKVYKKIQKISSPHPNLLGDRAIYGVMPDWNPAEIIGLRPKPLALSLYKELITDRTWAYQRDNYGYRNLRSHPLLVSFLGVPFIDVRVCFNSFVPKQLPDRIARKLVDYYIDRLKSIPQYHDKVEFRIVFSCFYLGLDRQLSKLKQHGFNISEIDQIQGSLLALTNQIIAPDGGLYVSDIRKIDILKEKYRQIRDSDLPLIDKIYWLVEDCKRYGTLPFAGVARAAFIGVQFLHSFVRMNILTPPQMEAFMGSLSTVTRKLSRDLCRLAEGNLDKEAFLSEYGHLRPGTYDILSPNYRDGFDRYFGSLSSYRAAACSPPAFELDRQQMAQIDQALSESGLGVDARGLIRFIQSAIEGREYAKFVFTRSLNETLVLIDRLGRRFDIDTMDMAYVNILDILNLYSSVGPEDIREYLRHRIAYNQTSYELGQLVKFPALIVSPEDIYDFFLESDKPNFITMKRAFGDTVSEDRLHDDRLEGKIVFIRSADPGYDFLFTRGIAGLITQYGGANSHMAIRCAELGIPAVIGAGEKKFSLWQQQDRIEINCMSQEVHFLN